MQLLIIELELLKNNLAFLKSQNEITAQLLMITEAAIRNKKTSLFNTIINFFKELLLCNK